MADFGGVIGPWVFEFSVVIQFKSIGSMSQCPMGLQTQNQWTFKPENKLYAYLELFYVPSMINILFSV